MGLEVGHSSGMMSKYSEREKEVSAGRVRIYGQVDRLE